MDSVEKDIGIDWFQRRKRVKMLYVVGFHINPSSGLREWECGKVVCMLSKLMKGSSFTPKDRVPLLALSRQVYRRE